MSNLLDLAPQLVPLLAQGQAIRRAEVTGFTDGGLVEVRLPGMEEALACELLNPESASALLSQGDAVLLWLGDGAHAQPDVPVILGRIGAREAAAQPVVSAAQFASRPESLVIETQGDLVLRNGQARIKLGAQGDVEIVCTSFATRSQRLLRLLAPLIKLN